MTSERPSKQAAGFEFDISSCMAMMEKLMSEHWESFECDEMMSLFIGQEGIPEDWMSVMSQLMEYHSGKAEGGSE